MEVSNIHCRSVKQDKIQVMKGESGLSNPTIDQKLHDASASPGSQLFLDNF